MIFPTKDIETNIDEEFDAAVEYLPNVRTCPNRSGVVSGLV
jgi:hypothetical protein